MEQPESDSFSFDICKLKYKLLKSAEGSFTYTLFHSSIQHYDKLKEHLM